MDRVGEQGISYDLCEAVLAARRGTMDLGGRKRRDARVMGSGRLGNIELRGRRARRPLRILPGGISFQLSKMASHNLRAPYLVRVSSALRRVLSSILRAVREAHGFRLLLEPLGRCARIGAKMGSCFHLTVA